MVEHVNLTGSQVHETKGVSAATAGDLGFASSGAISWTTLLGASTSAASTSSQLDFTGLSHAAFLKVQFVDLLHSAASTLNFRVSSNNGSTYLSTSIYDSVEINDAESVYSTDASAGIIGNNDQVYKNGYVNFYYFNNAGDTFFEGMCVASSSAGGAGTAQTSYYTGIVDSATAFNAIRFYPSTGTLTSGDIYVQTFRGN